MRSTGTRHDLTRDNTNTHASTSTYNNYYQLTDKILCTKYSYGGYVEIHSHGVTVTDGEASTDIHADAL